MSTEELRARACHALDAIGTDAVLGEPTWHGLPASTPITGEVLFTVPHTTPERADRIIAAAAGAFPAWRSTPAPARGALVARLGELLTRHKDDLATLVTLEVGKITSEALGEVQEMIDVCQFAVGLSRQLYGRTIASERPGHRLLETWHPLGVVGVITAFNFPVAVWAWNAAVALVCGDTVVWKPSELTPLTALACQALIGRAAADVGAPAPVSGLVLGERDLGERLVDDPRIALVSATGSVRMGQQVGPRVARRFGRSLLELGGNNAAVVTPSADLELAVRAIVFAAAGTAGQRCTTLRRLIVHRSVADDVVRRIAAAYRQLPIGDPATEGTLLGPLIHETAYRDMVGALEQARADGWEFMGHSYEQGPIHAEPDQKAMVERSLGIIERFTGKRPLGWLGPGLTETWETPDLLVEEGYGYVADWVLDDQPVWLKTRGKPIVNLPYTQECNDVAMMLIQHHKASEYSDRALDQFEQIYADSADSARVMAISIHPYIMGAPHRVKYFRKVIEHIRKKQDVLFWTGEQILDWFLGAEPQAP